MDWAGFEKHFNDTITPKLTQLAAEEVRRNTLPKAPADVKLELSKEFKLPDGMDWKFDASRPELAKVQEIAVKRGLDQETVSEFLDLYASTQVGEKAAYDAAVKAQHDKLGANVTVRATAVDTFLKGTLGEQPAAELNKVLITAGAFEAVEKLISRMVSQGAAGFSQAHREPGGQTGRVSEAEYNAMGAAERWSYAKSFDQKQFQNGTGR